MAAVLAACSPVSKPAPTPEQAALLRPSDPRLSALYEASCKACHAVPGTGAPMVHDRAAWDPRWKKGGVDVLIDNTLIGYKGMPPGGQCGGCGVDDYGPLIRFMADREESAK